MTFVGKDVRRPDGPDKVRGRAQYIADIAVPGVWYGATLRSPVARGRLFGIDRDPGFDWSTVSVVEAGDIPGDNVVALIVDDQPLLAQDAIAHFGEALALVAAPTRELAAAALAALTPRIDEQTPVLDMELSEQVLKEISIEKGDPLGELESAARIVTHTWHTDSQEQLYIETQGMVAWPPDASGGLQVQGSLQCPHYVQKALARAFDVPAEKARVVQAATGGGFGGKEDYPSVVACHAALLARASGQPVQLIYDRHEDLAVTPKRHPSRVTHRTAFDDEGKLLAMDIDVLMDAGAYTTLSPVVLSRGVIHAAGPYRCDHVRIRGRVVATNHVPYGAFRGFGAPQTCFAIERQMDRIACELNLHPVELRKRNMLRVGDTTATGQTLETSVGSEEVMSTILASTGIDAHDWGAAQDPNARVRRGRGFSFFFHGAGFTGAGETLLKGQVRLALETDGRVRVMAGSTEIGQGTNTMFLAIAADALATEIDDVVIADVDTDRVPNSGPTVASRTCMIVGGCLSRACAELLARIGGEPAQSFRERALAFLAAGGDGTVTVTYDSPPGLEWNDETYEGDAYPCYGWAADVVDIEVDMDSFDVRITNFISAVDVGKAIQPQLVRGQIEGGSLQALGFAHLEVMNTKDGRFQQDRLATCIIPTSLDAPPMEVHLIEEPFAHGPYGAKGVGELPMDGGAPAVASALEDALGVSLNVVPATPERLLAAWLEQHPEERA
jgi:CO/xanthine dehydrogenase Mo-binding subunit